MSYIDVTDHVKSVGVLNPTMRIFDIIMQTEYGTSYNAYLIRGDKNILIDNTHHDFFDEYLENISELIDPKEIDILVVNHTELDHSGSIKALLEINPNIVIYCTAAADRYLQAILNRPFESVIVKDNQELDIGIGTLKFIMAPFLHWPDTMMVYFDTDKVLFSCDFLGAHYCEPQMFDTFIQAPERPLYEESFQYYYDCIMAPFKSFVVQGLNKIEGLALDYVCTSHGPILKDNIEWAKNQYAKWSKAEDKSSKKRVTILHAASYGCTTQLAQAAKEALQQEYDVTMLDLVTEEIGVVATHINECDALLVGSDTINRDATPPVWMALAHIDAINAGRKPCGAFGSYGWSGEAVGMIMDRFASLRMHPVGEGFKINFVPTEKDLNAMVEYAKTVVAEIK